MQRVFGILGVACLALFGAACGGDDDDSEDLKVDCSGTVPTYAELMANSTIGACAGCHNSNLKDLATRQNAPLGIDFDAYTAASNNAKKGASEVNEGAMPPAPQTFTAQQKADFLKWALCGKPQGAMGD